MDIIKVGKLVESTKEEVLHYSTKWTIDNFIGQCTAIRGNFLASSSFEFGGYKWALCFFPNGHHQYMDERPIWSTIALQFQGVVDVTATLFMPTVHVTFALVHPSDKIKTIGHICDVDTYKKNGNVVMVPRGQFILFDDIAAKGFIINNTVSFQMSFNLFSQGAAPQQKYLGNGKNFHMAIGNAALNGDFADCILELADGTKQPAHKLILAARSPVFRAAFTNHMAESRESLIKLPADFDISTVKFLLLHAYTCWVPQPHDLAVVEKSSASQQQATKSLDGLDGLDDGEMKDDSVSKKSIIVDIHKLIHKWSWNTIFHLYRAADLYAFDDLSLACLPVLKCTLSPTHLVEAVRFAQAAKQTASTVHAQFATMVQDYVRNNVETSLEALLNH